MKKRWYHKEWTTDSRGIMIGDRLFWIESKGRNTKAGWKKQRDLEQYICDLHNTALATESEATP